ncbi:MAG: rRNA pseudouridine synthase [Myxococcaceae bacterium]|nr:rRNA pseudouridine synthase [Myxococcaceae bacterium]MBH2006624.1 rRNA pseudouridine synthase [Myxococcaceae bacterium]
MSKERLHKALARAGVASRRQVEKMIDEGKVRVNDSQVRTQGFIIDPDADCVYVDGKRIHTASEQITERVYFLLYKPVGTVSTARDTAGRKTVIDLVLGAAAGRIYPVGRLDYDAEGALLMTNDGELTNQLIHPKYHVPKVYEVKVKGTPSEEQLNKLRRGIYLPDGPTGSSEIEVLRKAKVNTWLRVVLTQGKNNQIKNMFWRIEHPAQKLIRTHFAGISIAGLAPGEFRPLTKKELATLRSSAKR